MGPRHLYVYTKYITYNAAYRICYFIIHFVLKNKNREVCQFDKILDQMVEFWGGVAALRGIKKFFSLASLADFLFRKVNLKKKFKANFLGDLLIKIQILKLKGLKF